MRRDSIDFGKEHIPTLFRKILVPTLLGMVCMSAMTIIDGAFVGHAVGSNALAAINIFCPLWLLMSGIGLMLGMGCSVVASIHLAKDNVKAARLNLTQTVIFGSFISLLIYLVVRVFEVQSARMLGASDILLPDVLVYQKWMSRSFISIFLQSVGLLIIRLDGSPKFSMVCLSLPAIINVVLDYVTLYILDWGLEGVAIATMIGCTTGGVLVLFYLLFLSNKMKFYKQKLSITSLKLSARNIGYQLKLGFSALLGELCIAMILFVGNYVFLKHLKEDGVAAFSVACYILPFIFMTGNSIAQSAQPIISFNYGAGQSDRVKQARDLSLYTAFGLALILTLAFIFFVKYIVMIFLPPTANAYQIASAGLPFLAIGFIPFVVNVSYIGYCQSVERPGIATVLSLCRGVLYLVPSFILMPQIAGTEGIWLAVPSTEVLTLATAILWAWYVKKSRYSK
ncbi:MAG TPA: MATE family efflux transporter [Paludibacteraceae bacterium]|nr:MATE family efflux transporter [Paludibacteraceae bacterium]